MEDVLDVYARPCDPKRPQVCFDETCKQQLREVTEPLSPQPGSPARTESTYQRNGVSNLLLAFAPLQQWRHVWVADRRDAITWAHCIRELVDVHFPEAERIVLVMDNLSTHTASALYTAFAPEEAKRIWDRLSDRLSAYNSLPLARRQLCWAHFVRNLRGRAEAKGPWQQDAMALLALAEEVMVVWACYREGSLDRTTMQGMLRALQQAMWERIEAGQQQMNTLGSLCCDLAPRFSALWTFLDVEGLEPTNNAAERALRPAVLWRKGCFGTQSEGGSLFVERMLTVSATCQQQQRSLLPFLVDAISAHWAGQPAPALLPSAAS